MSRDRTLIIRLGAEAGAIFLGVSLGFLADDYRAFRNDRGREREALEQMLYDLEIDSLDFAPILRQSQVRLDAAMWLFQLSDRRVAPSADSLTLVVDSVARTALHSYEASNHTYSGLKAAGSLELIRDLELRRKIVYYFEDRQPAMEVLNAGLLESDGRWWDLLAQYVRFLPSGDLRGAYPEVVVDDPSGAWQDRRLTYETVNLATWSEGQIDAATQLFELHGALVEDIRRYLGYPEPRPN